MEHRLLFWGPVTALTHPPLVVPGYIQAKEKCFTISLFIALQKKGKLTIELRALERSIGRWYHRCVTFFRCFAIFPLPKWYLVGVKTNTLTDLKEHFSSCCKQ